MPVVGHQDRAGAREHEGADRVQRAAAKPNAAPAVSSAPVAPWWQRCPPIQSRRLAPS